MKIVSKKAHGLIDYLLGLFLIAAPMAFGFVGMLAYFTYLMAVVYLLIAVFTDYGAGIFKQMPFALHGTIELLLGIALVGIAYTLFRNNEHGKIFYTIFGGARLLIALLSDYK